MLLRCISNGFMFCDEVSNYNSNSSNFVKFNIPDDLKDKLDIFKSYMLSYENEECQINNIKIVNISDKEANQNIINDFSNENPTKNKKSRLTEKDIIAISLENNEEQLISHNEVANEYKTISISKQLSISSYNKETSEHDNKKFSFENNVERINKDDNAIEKIDKVSLVEHMKLNNQNDVTGIDSTEIRSYEISYSDSNNTKCRDCKKSKSNIPKVNL